MRILALALLLGLSACPGNSHAAKQGAKAFVASIYTPYVSHSNDPSFEGAGFTARPIITVCSNRCWRRYCSKRPTLAVGAGTLPNWITIR